MTALLIASAADAAEQLRETSHLGKGFIDSAVQLWERPDLGPSYNITPCCYVDGIFWVHNYAGVQHIYNTESGGCIRPACYLGSPAKPPANLRGRPFVCNII